MAIHLDEFLTKLPPNKREAIGKRAAELIAEDAAKHPEPNNH